MIKQSTAVIALLLASSNATKMSRKAPKSINLFATGMNGDEDLGQDIIMKGDKFHYQQNLSESENAPAATTPVAVGPNGQPVQQAPIKKLVSVNARAREDPKVEEKKEEKKTEEKKEEKKDEKKTEEKKAKEEEKKEEKTEEKKEEADDEEEGEEKEFK